jgi:hypothetical protein
MAQERAKPADLPASCYRCKGHMEEIMRIAPLLHEPGLVAYECGQCGYLTSVVEPPIDPRRGSG